MQSGEADFLQGFTALLTDEELRRRFSRNPTETAAHLCADAEAIANLAALHPDDLHYQSEVLLKKRYAAIKRYLPPPIADHPACSWSNFRAYGETAEPRGSDDSPWLDAYNFLKFVSNSEHIDAQRELNRLEFMARRKRIDLKLITSAGKRGGKWPCLQLLVRNGDACKDILIGFQL